MLTSRHLSEFPDVRDFIRITKSLAALDAVVSPEWEYRYYSFDSNWDKGEMMASMRNGSGDNWYALILDCGIALQGLDHESPTFVVGQPRSWVFADLPEDFRKPFLDEPAFDSSNSTFCIWNHISGSQWQSGVVGLDQEIDDGSQRLLEILSGSPELYIQFSEEYYEESLPLAAVQSVYEHTPISVEIAESLNSETVTSELAIALDEIGYPHTL